MRTGRSTFSCVLIWQRRDWFSLGGVLGVGLLLLLACSQRLGAPLPEGQRFFRRFARELFLNSFRAPMLHRNAIKRLRFHGRSL